MAENKFKLHTFVESEIDDEISENEAVAFLETAGEYNIPMLMIISNYDECYFVEDCECIIDTFGVTHDYEIFKSEEELKFSGSMMDRISMVPIGIFPIDVDNEEDAKEMEEYSGQKPSILFSGTVRSVEYDDDHGPGPAYHMIVETLDFSFHLAASECDRKIEEGDIIQGFALMIGTIEQISQTDAVLS